MTMAKTVRIGGASGYWGDTASFLRQLRAKVKERESAPVGSAP